MANPGVWVMLLLLLLGWGMLILDSRDDGED